MPAFSANCCILPQLKIIDNMVGKTVTPWIWNIAEKQFYGATQIVDLFHAREHYWNVARNFFGQDKDRLHRWTEERREELDAGSPEAVAEAIKGLSL